METTNPDLIPLADAATLTGYSVGHLRRAVKAGDVSGWRRGKRLILVDREEILTHFFKRL